MTGFVLTRALLEAGGVPDPELDRLAEMVAAAQGRALPCPRKGTESP